MKVLYVCNLYSPFQVELANAINALGEVEFYIAFTRDKNQSRGDHWFQSTEDTDSIRVCRHPDNRTTWLREELERVRPDLILNGGYRKHRLLSVVFEHRRRQPGTRVGFWAEVPFPASSVVQPLKRAVVRWIVNRFDFAIAIGDRAYATYAGALGPIRTCLVPYGQDLSDFYNLKRAQRQSGDPVRFLFSGRLIPQHNIGGLIEGVRRAIEDAPGTFELVVAAYGKEQRHIDRAVATSTAFRDSLRYDRDYESWSDRTRPFGYSDVLLYPSYHSGWGLVVPEAMAAGMVVVSSQAVESARHLIQPGVTGFFTGTSPTAVMDSIRWCISNAEQLPVFGVRAKEGSRRVTAERIASDMSLAFRAVWGNTVAPPRRFY